MIDQNDCPRTIPIRRDNCCAENSDSAAQEDETLCKTLEAALPAINTQGRNINNLAYSCPYYGPALQLCKPLTMERVSHGDGSTAIAGNMKPHVADRKVKQAVVHDSVEAEAYQQVISDLNKLKPLLEPVKQEPALSKPLLDGDAGISCAKATAATVPNREDVKRQVEAKNATAQRTVPTGQTWKWEGILKLDGILAFAQKCYDKASLWHVNNIVQRAELKRCSRISALDHDTSGNFQCITEKVSSKCIHEVRAGYANRRSNQRTLSIWRLKSKLTYVVDTESFPSYADAETAKRALECAADQWNRKEVAVTFHLTGPNERAAFVLKYAKGPDNILATAFFPDSNDRTLYVYELAFLEEIRDKMANVFLHELGHILGLRHEFAGRTEHDNPSAQVSPGDPRSVMGYFNDLNFEIQDSDVRGLQYLYSLEGDSLFKGFRVVVVDPEIWGYWLVRRYVAGLLSLATSGVSWAVGPLISVLELGGVMCSTVICILVLYSSRSILQYSRM
ncbi:hypothetical protein GP486_000023 [Trichoglossum hirsutum]|uniref:Peptidase metallopeptidase domain-containing protein n=1 Tax=Trichoglossum hirsutum TaxID=265104 RepID=A0A9P8RTZ1_9PEZI|nr:hypothetical protein GP486_000023 [Trichoglossum hirsutum]